MAVLYLDSMQTYSTAQMPRRYALVNAYLVTAVEISPVLHPGISRMVKMANSSSEGSMTRALGSNVETIIIGGWFAFSASNIAAAFIQLYDGATLHSDLRITTTAQLAVTRNGTVLATSTNTFAINTWYHIEIKVTIGDAGDTPSGRYEVRVNGTATGWIPDSGTGQDTRNAGNKYVTHVKLRQGQGVDVSCAGFYILDTTGSVATDFLGINRIVALRPAGVGNYAQWTPNYAGNQVNVAEIFSDDDNSFNQSSTANNIDSFPLDELPAGATVYAVQHSFVARQDAGAARVIAPLARISTTDYPGTSVNTGASYSVFVETLTLSPASSAQWTVSEVNGAEFGYKLIS